MFARIMAAAAYKARIRQRKLVNEAVAGAVCIESFVILVIGGKRQTDPNREMIAGVRRFEAARILDREALAKDVVGAEANVETFECRTSRS
jgi:hypothetical protein